MTNKKKAGFLKFLHIYSNHFQFKGTQFHLTDVRKSYKGIKNFILYFINKKIFGLDKINFSDDDKKNLIALL